MRALLLGLLLAACAPSVAFPPAPEALAGAGAGRAWLAGTRGYAALHDGRALVRRDYPMIDGEERYELSTLPAARVFTTDRGAVLVLRTGEVLRSTPAGWLGVGALIAPGDQLDQAASNGDALVVVTNARRLLRLSLAAVARGVLAPLEARAPTYPSWLGWLGEELWMTGWDEGGSVPAAWRLEGAGWRVVARWPSRRATLRGVMRTRYLFGGGAFLDADSPPWLGGGADARMAARRRGDRRGSSGRCDGRQLRRPIAPTVRSGRLPGDRRSSSRAGEGTSAIERATRRAPLAARG